MESQIIEKALIALNRKGYVRSQLQDILEESLISLEEFNHHFSDFNDLIVSIFDQFCKEVDQASAGLDPSGSMVKGFYESLMATFKVHKKYSFIFHDFYYLNTEVDEIKDRYFELLRFRKAQFSHLFQVFVEAGIIKKEVIAGQFENLTNQMLVLGGFWPTHSYIIFGEYNDQYYSKLTFSMLVPYFTEKGLEECKRISHL
ncbi:MAG: TetR/AcrR family transcriptional regulator [Anditalea sp.]